MIGRPVYDIPETAVRGHRERWRSRCRVSLACFICGVLLVAADWPQFRGPDRTGVGAATGLADKWPDGGPSVRWRVEFLGEGYGSTAVTDGVVYVQGTHEGQSSVFAIDDSNGELKWRVDLGPMREQDQGNGPRSTPTVRGDGLYVINERGEVAHLAREDGKVRWQFNMLERYGASNIRWSISESPLVDDRRVYLMPGGDDGSIVAIDRYTGEPVWRSEELRDGTSYSSLIFVDVDGERAIAGFTQQAGVGVRASDGKLLWRYETPANRTANAAMPVVGDDLVFYTSSYGVGGGAVHIGSGDQGQEAWFRSNLQNHHGGVVYYDGHLYGFFGPALACVVLETGEIRWRARSVGKGSLAIADGKLYLLSERRRVAVAKASPAGYEEGGRFEIEDRGEPTWANPAIAGDTLYIRNQNVLEAYDVGAGD